MPHLFLQKVTLFIFFSPVVWTRPLVVLFIKARLLEKCVNIIDGQIYAFHVFKFKQCHTSPTTAPKNRTWTTMVIHKHIRVIILT